MAVDTIILSGGQCFPGLHCMATSLTAVDSTVWALQMYCCQSSGRSTLFCSTGVTFSDNVTLIEQIKLSLNVQNLFGLDLFELLFCTQAAAIYEKSSILVMTSMPMRQNRD